MDVQHTERVRLEAAALLALGWVPSADEPGRLYPMEADMPSVKVPPWAWVAMLELLAERRRD